MKVLLTLKKLVSLNAFMSLDTSMKGLLRSLLPSIRFFTQPVGILLSALFELFSVEPLLDAR